MDRSELAALISSTMHSYAAVRAPIYHPAPISQSRLPIPTCRSPRQDFQTCVRGLGHARKSLSEADAHLDSRPKTPKSEDGRTPRPRHRRNYSYLPQARTPKVVTLNQHDGRKARKSMTAQIEEEPDFVREEREAWSKKSPKRPKQSASPHQAASAIAGDSTESLRRRPIVFEPPRPSRNPPPQPRKQVKQTIPLREFAPMREQTDTEDRPKTSRGTQLEPPGDLTSFYEESSENGSTKDRTSNNAIRPSKFLEGSLNDRSGAVASSWYEHGSISEDEFDSDATPRASRDTRVSSSFDSNDSKALPNTPATIKRRLFRMKSSIRSSGDSERSAGQQQQPVKKGGLRKSLSTWNFHNFGDKMKIFGASSHDLTPKAVKENRQNCNTSNLPPFEVLDDRKRKAEEAYIKHFSLKKQKSNSGLATPNSSQSQPLLPKPSSLKRRTPSGASCNSSSSHSQRRRVPSSSTIASFASDHSSSDIDHNKRPSRKDLEKENQQLRAMLRKTASMTHFQLHQDPRRSSYHLPLDEEAGAGKENQNRLTQQNFAQGNAIRLSPGKRMGLRGEDVPPVPPVPREVLGGLQNGRNGRSVSNGGAGKGVFPRPVSMIMEEEDMGLSEEHRFNVQQLIPTQNRNVDMGRAQEQWEWPDDVF